MHGAVRPADRRVRRPAEIGVQEVLRRLGRKPGIGGRTGEVEHGGGKAGIFEIDQPQPLPVIEDVARQEVVVAEDDGQRHLRRLQFVGKREIGGKLRQHAAAPRPQGPCIVAHHMERPEEEGGAADLRRHCGVEPAQQVGDAPPLRNDVPCPEGPCPEIGRHHDTRLRIADFRPEARGMGGARGHQFPLADNVMKGVILAEAHHMAPCPVADKVALVADAAAQRCDLDGAAPARQAPDTVFDRAGEHGMPVHQRPSLGWPGRQGRPQPCNCLPSRPRIVPRLSCRPPFHQCRSGNVRLSIPGCGFLCVSARL